MQCFWTLFKIVSWCTSVTILQPVQVAKKTIDAPLQHQVLSEEPGSHPKGPEFHTARVPWKARVPCTLADLIPPARTSSVVQQTSTTVLNWVLNIFKNTSGAREPSMCLLNCETTQSHRNSQRNLQIRIAAPLRMADAVCFHTAQIA